MTDPNYPFDVGPNALYRNFPIVPQFYTPSLYYIVGITNGKSTTVTTATTHNYLVGQQVRFIIPPTYGERELNEQSGLITSIPSPTSFIVAIDSSKYNTFIASPVYGPTLPQVTAIGDVNSGVNNNSNGRLLTGVTLPGSFTNISPNEGTWLS